MMWLRRAGSQGIYKILFTQRGLGPCTVWCRWSHSSPPVLTSGIRWAFKMNPVERKIPEDPRRAKGTDAVQSGVCTSATGLTSSVNIALVRTTALSEMALWKRFLARGDSTWKGRGGELTLKGDGQWLAHLVKFPPLAPLACRLWFSLHVTAPYLSLIASQLSSEPGTE